LSKPRLKLQAVIDTEANADTIITQIRNELVGKDIFEEHNLSYQIDESGQVNLIFDFRFNNRIDRDDMKNWIKDQAQNNPQVKDWIQSVTVTEHLCSHDDVSIKDCTTTEYVRWERV